MHLVLYGWFLCLVLLAEAWQEAQFLCEDGLAIIPISSTCDGTPHCTDGSDESEGYCRSSKLFNLLNLPQHSSRCWSPRWFRCESGGCVSRTKRCDGRIDCTDASDEAHCPSRPDSCRSNEWKCRNGDCILFDAACNGTIECKDGSDETLDKCSSTLKCAEGMFRCTYGACILRSQMCDGKPQCADSSDESQSLCAVGCKVPQNLSPPLQVTVVGCDKPSSCTEVSNLGGLHFSCAAGYQLQGEKYSICAFGNWSSPQLPTCVSTSQRLDKCPGFDDVTSEVEVTCLMTSGALNSCKKSQSPGTIAYFRCMQNSQQKVEAHCGINGQWSAEPPVCMPICGIAPSSAYARIATQTPGLNWGPLIIHGSEASPGQWPWHVGLYLLKNNSEWHYHCGGTLVSDTAVITAAHCVHRHKPENLLVALNKYHRLYNISDPDTQFIKIREILKPEAYYEDINAYDSDIAMLVLAERAKFSSQVRPACLDWRRTAVGIHLSEGSSGIVAGWGVTETDELADVLRYTRLDFVPLPECSVKVVPDFRRYLRSSTFCAGTVNGTSACNGDSGGGLMFALPGTGAWTLQGVVSLSPRRAISHLCDPNFPTVFTRVASFLPEMIVPWLQRAAQLWQDT